MLAAPRASYNRGRNGSHQKCRQRPGEHGEMPSSSNYRIEPSPTSMIDECTSIANSRLRIHLVSCVKYHLRESIEILWPKERQARDLHTHRR